ncbi:unnamed protein product [Rhodiola kirilowii]
MADLTYSQSSAAKMQSHCKQLHIVLFPWIAFGHMIPYLELAKLIAAKGHRVSFVSTSRNIERLPEISSELTPFITMVKLKLKVDDILPLDADATIDVPFDKVQYLKRAYDALQEQLAEFLEDAKPDWILYDFIPYWISSIAKRLDIGCAFFSIFIPEFVCVVPVPTSDLLKIEDDRTAPEHFTVPPKWIPFQTTVAYRLYEIIKIFDSVEDTNASGITDMERIVLSVKDCDLICIRGCNEFDAEWIQLAQKLHGKPVIPVGQLPTSVTDPVKQGDTKLAQWLEIKAWLDQHDSASVVYVSFGTEAKPSQEEVTELAYGLELSGLPFFWVLRTRRGSADKDVMKLPEGFEERTAGRGVVYTSWVPQINILSHKSIGGFLSHSGWSSVVEALQFSKALVLVTFLADQGINARVLEEKMIGYLIPRRENDGWFGRESVADSLRLVMVDKEGNVFRDKAKEMSKVFGDIVLQDGYVNNFLAFLDSHRHNQEHGH